MTLPLVRLLGWNLLKFTINEITIVPDFILNHSDIIFDGKKSPEELILELQQEIIEEDDDDECEYLIEF